MGKLSPTEGLDQIMVDSLVSGRVKPLAEEHHGARQSHQIFLSSMLTCQMRQRTVATWQNCCEGNQRKQASNFVVIMVLSLEIRVRQKI